MDSPNNTFLQDKITQMLDKAEFLEYLTEEAFRSLDKEGTGLVKVEKIKETVSNLSPELKIPKMTEKEQEKLNLAFEGIGEQGINLEDFKRILKDLLYKMFENCNK